LASSKQFGLVLAFAAFHLLAHDIPRDVTVQAYLRPSGGSLQLVLRAPLSAMRDIEFPQRGPGYLDFAKADAATGNAARLWLMQAIDVYADGARLTAPRVAAVRASLDSDKAFASFDDALAMVRSPRFGNDVNLYWNQAMLDVLFEYEIRPGTSRFSVEPKFARLGQSVLTVFRFVPAPGVVRAYEFRGDPGLVNLDPSWMQSALRFVQLGFEHILEGYDHLLFLLCLVIPFRRFLALIPVVTAFTAAHSVTLIASAYGMGPSALWFAPAVETAIAVSIVYMALENIVREKGVAHRWLVAFAFGLVHGFGFSFALRESLQFAGSHLLTSLLAFNLGVELGQVVLLVLAIPVLELLFQRVVAERMGTILISAFIAHTGWHWSAERWATLAQYRFEWPAFDAAFWALSLRWSAIILLLAGALWWIHNAVEQRRRTASSSQD
jgi:hypothetical protein